MSWSVSFQGDAEAIGKAFDAEYERSKSNGMNDDELQDIQDTRDYVFAQAERYGPQRGTAAGHHVTTVEEPSSRFGKVYVEIYGDWQFPAETATEVGAEPLGNEAAVEFRDGYVDPHPAISGDPTA